MTINTIDLAKEVSPEAFEEGIRANWGSDGIATITIEPGLIVIWEQVDAATEADAIEWLQGYNWADVIEHARGY